MALTIETASRKDKSTGSDIVQFQHRHFAKIAAIIANMEKVHNQENGFIDVREDIADEFARALASTNPNFNRARFLKACGF